MSLIINQCGILCIVDLRNVFLVCPMKNAPVLVVKKKSDGDYKHFTLPTDGEVRTCTSYAITNKLLTQN